MDENEQLVLRNRDPLRKKVTARFRLVFLPSFHNWNDFLIGEISQRFCDKTMTWKIKVSWVLCFFLEKRNPNGPRAELTPPAPLVSTECSEVPFCRFFLAVISWSAVDFPDFTMPPSVRWRHGCGAVGGLVPGKVSDPKLVAICRIRPVFPSWILILWIRIMWYFQYLVGYRVTVPTYQKHGFWIGIHKNFWMESSNRRWQNC